MKLYIFFVLGILLSGCELFIEYNWEFPEKISSVEEALDYMKTVDNRNDYRDDWALPDETYSRGYGDCEDHAALLCNILIYKLGIDAKLIHGYNNGYGHMAVEANGVIYDGTYPRTKEQFTEYWSTWGYYSYDGYCKKAKWN